MNDIPVLSILIFLPIVAGIICLFLPGQVAGTCRASLPCSPP
ncbi:MAG: hypothetical protein U0232_00215 [Thermomicrobiales bacterium]